VVIGFPVEDRDRRKPNPIRVEAKPLQNGMNRCWVMRRYSHTPEILNNVKENGYNRSLVGDKPVARGRSGDILLNYKQQITSNN